MCGIFGWQWHTRPEASEGVALAAALMWLNDARGKDGWGVFTPAQTLGKGKGYMTDNVSPLDLAPHLTLIGHTRFATRGSASDDNAHPFTVGPITGCHNGAIWNAYELDRKYSEYKKFRVDSHYLIAHIANNRPCDELTGYGTVAWVDNRERDHKVFLARFRGELALVQTQHGVVWSSSRRALDTALAAAHMTATTTFVTDDDGTLHFVAAGSLFRAAPARLAIRAAYVDTWDGNGWAACGYPPAEGRGKNGHWFKRHKADKAYKVDTKTITVPVVSGRMGTGAPNCKALADGQAMLDGHAPAELRGIIKGV